MTVITDEQFEDAVADLVDLHRKRKEAEKEGAFTQMHRLEWMSQGYRQAIKQMFGSRAWSDVNRKAEDEIEKDNA